jgi:phenylalanyl-tRNA synthetase beta chain
LGFEMVGNPPSPSSSVKASADRLPKGGTANPPNPIPKGGGKEKVVWRVPFWRLDLEGEADLYEEIGRMEGYEKIEPQILPTGVEAPRRNQLREFEWRVRDDLTALGFDEVMNYSFYAQEDQEAWKISGDHWELENPLSQEGVLLRKTLLPGLIKNVALNSKNLDRFLLFEIGKIFPFDSNDSKGINQKEEVLLAGALFDKDLKEEAVFHQLKGRLESFLKKKLEGELEWEEKSNKIAGVSLLEAKIKLKFSAKKQSESLGRVMVVNPKLAQAYGIKAGRMVFFELNLEKLFFSRKGVTIFHPLDKFPGVFRDISLYVQPMTPLARVAKIIELQGEERLKSWQLFDIYFDSQTKKKSLALRLELAHPERTLQGGEVEKIMQKIIVKLEKEGFQVRKSEA